ncbi:winged helix-turn-helix domain-containing protein [Tsuneonella sp. HG249]
MPQREFRNPLLLTLHELGGAGSLTEIREHMHPKVASRLREADYHIVSTGEERWWNATCWERSELVKAGYLRSNSLRGRWELSDLGKKAALKLKNPD